MDTEILICFIAIAITYVLWVRSKKIRLPKDASTDTRALFEWHDLSDRQKTVPEIEKYLAQHPDNLSRRQGILSILAYGDTRDPDRLRYHTLELICRWPVSSDIVFSNYSEFFRNHDYRKEVAAALESQLGKGLDDGEIHGNLASIHAGAALPIPESEHEEFRSWHQLEPDTVLPTELNEQELATAIRHYQQAFALLPDGEWRKTYQLEQLAELLSKAGRLEEAIETFEQVQGMVENQASLLADYGECLITAGRIEEAVAKLRQVRECDKEGFEDGPGCQTMTAETLMGHVAGKQGDWAKAAGHLAASTDVQPCCHTTTDGFLTYLARELMPHDRPAVASFCRKVLAKFTPNDPDIQTLLDEAER